VTRARRPLFLRIAPGLLLPPVDAAGFAAAQASTQLPRESDAQILPVCLFSAAREGSHYEADLTASSCPFHFEGYHSATYAHGELPSRIPAGVYSEAIDRNSYDIAEEGFRLLLPYNLSGGACKSDGSLVTPNTMNELFQHGYKPFGGDYYRPQRLEHLLDHWSRLVADGVWSVGSDGVEGTIERFREADTPAHWREYMIPPTWLAICPQQGDFPPLDRA